MNFSLNKSKKEDYATAKEYFIMAIGNQFKEFGDPSHPSLTQSI